MKVDFFTKFIAMLASTSFVLFLYSLVSYAIQPNMFHFKEIGITTLFSITCVSIARTVFKKKGLM